MKNSDRSLKLDHVLMIALLGGLLPDSVFAAMPGFAPAVVPVPGPALTDVGINDGGDQPDPHVSGGRAAYSDCLLYGISFQKLDLGLRSDRLIPRLAGAYNLLTDIIGDTIMFSPRFSS